MEKYEALWIGDLCVKKPVIQGGMGVGISLSGLSGAVAAAGGMGLISTAQIGFREPDFVQNPVAANLRAMETELAKARRIAPEGVIGFNIMTATRDYPAYVKKAVEAGADVIVSGAGLPTELPALTQGSRVKIAPIVSSARAASVICRLWEKRYHRTPDFLVVEGPLAGGHLGFSREELEKLGADRQDADQAYDRAAYEREIRSILAVAEEAGRQSGRPVPVICAGGIFDREDMARHMALGAGGVQIGTRFVTTWECDAPQEFKDAYIHAKKEDIVIVKSPVGMPGRAIRNPFLEKTEKSPGRISRCFRCLQHCDPLTAPYCITRALIRAARGQVEDGLLFCGYNAWRCERMERVKDVIEDLCR